MESLQVFVMAMKGLAYMIAPFSLVVCVYRLYVHPLSQYPGPPIARLSDFYGAYYAVKTILHVRTFRDHQRYGSVMRHGPNKLVFNSLTQSDIYQNETVTKSRVYLVSQRAPGAYGLFNSLDKHMHQKKRKLLGPVVNNRSTRAFEASILSHIDVFLQGFICISHGTSIEQPHFKHLGSDTMSTCLSALFFYLSRYPDCYLRLTEEIRSAFTNSGDIRGGACLAGCYYLRACIDESLRMCPPVPGTLWRQQEAESDIKASPLVVDGHVIPPGTHIGPFLFKPERFLQENFQGPKSVKAAFAPFSLGARGCMGKSMAYLEASLIVAKTLWHFDFEQAPMEAGRLGEFTYWQSSRKEERVKEYQTYDIFGTAHDGPCLVFTPRHDL
ncbi:cytochrome P450 [Xylariaceae sp. AK1471]|nr:cytochrome P450 [Xylariaceae sp. AK1471]